MSTTLASQVNTINVNGGTTATEGIGTSEVLLDIVTALGAAPGANVVLFDTYPKNGTHLDLVNAAFNYLIGVQGNSSGIVGDSWGTCEYLVSDSDADSTEGLLQASKMSGVSFFLATGDFGPNCMNTSQNPPVVYPNRIQFPSHAPDAVAVGGTRLQVGAGNSYQSETWWNTQPKPNVFGTGAFGYSWHFGRPSYQDARGCASVLDTARRFTLVVPGAMNAQCQSTTQCTMASPAASAPGAVDVTYGGSPSRCSRSLYLYRTDGNKRISFGWKTDWRRADDICRQIRSTSRLRRDDGR